MATHSIVDYTNKIKSFFSSKQELQEAQTQLKSEVDDITDNSCGFTLGVVSSNGSVDDSIDNRVRFANFEFVRKGSTISVDSSDYKFNVALYSQKNSSSLIRFYSMRTGDDPIIIPQDCYIRASMGQVDNGSLLNADIAQHFKLNLIRDYVINRNTKQFKQHRYLENIYFAPIMESKAEFTMSDSAFDTFTENSTASDIYSFIRQVSATKYAEDEAVSAGYAYVHTLEMGNDASGQYPIKYYVCEAPSGNGNTSKLKPAFVIVAGQHGDEKVSQFACAHLIDLLLNKWQNNPVLEWLHWNAVLYIMPCANPWGAANGEYTNSNGVNINRNWGYEFTPDLTPGSSYTGTNSMSEKETQAIRNMVNVVKGKQNLVHLIDFHTNKDTLNNPQWNMTNWFSMVAIDGAIDKDLNKVLYFHGYKLSRQFKKEYSLNLPDAKKLFYISSNDGANMLKGYAQGILQIPAMTLECCGRLPEGTSYDPIVIKMATEMIANWVYDVCLELSKYTEV